MYYTGIGSRDAPEDILKYFTQVGMKLGNLGFTLRSGHADGCDLAFEKGCDIINGKKEIYLPWRNFNGSNSSLIFNFNDKKAVECAKFFHPYYDKLKPGAKMLIARDGYQVIGYDFKYKSRFVICYTENGYIKGGTAQAIRIANYLKIPVINIGKYTHLNEFDKIFTKYIDNMIY